MNLVELCRFGDDLLKLRSISKMTQPPPKIWSLASKRNWTDRQRKTNLAMHPYSLTSSSSSSSSSDMGNMSRSPHHTTSSLFSMDEADESHETAGSSGSAGSARSGSETVTVQHKTRRPHRKSRYGCTRCKVRRIKARILLHVIHHEECPRLTLTTIVR